MHTDNSSGIGSSRSFDGAVIRWVLSGVLVMAALACSLTVWGGSGAAASAKAVMPKVLSGRALDSLTVEVIRAGMEHTGDPLFAPVGSCRPSSTMGGVVLAPVPFSPDGTATCRLGAADHLFVTPAGAACLDKEIGQCTLAIVGRDVKATVSVDGVVLPASRLRRQQIDGITLAVVKGNTFGSPPGKAAAQLAGLAVDLGTLTAGHHVVVASATYGSTSLKRTLSINVG